MCVINLSHLIQLLRTWCCLESLFGVDLEAHFFWDAGLLNLSLKENNMVNEIQNSNMMIIIIMMNVINLLFTCCCLLNGFRVAFNFCCFWDAAVDFKWTGCLVVLVVLHLFDFGWLWSSSLKMISFGCFLFKVAL
jgi:hypothetical protein